LTGLAVAAVVEESVDGFLEHAHLVMDDDVGRLHLDELLQAVVAVDDATIEVVQVGGGEAAAFEGTSGRRSGGMTGSTVRIMCSGRLPEARKPSMIFMRRATLLDLLGAGRTESWSRRFSTVEARSIFLRSCWSASAPMPGLEGVRAVLFDGAAEGFLVELPSLPCRWRPGRRPGTSGSR
jgi:hypothetical protein